jgi:serine/threonine-protein kinase
MTDEAPSQIGPYAILEEIGRGGMSIVYRARDTRDERIVALKVLPPEMRHQPNLRGRFIKEGQRALVLNHRNIVHTFEASHSDGAYYIAMEFVQGETLSEYLKRNEGPVPVEEAIRVTLPSRRMATG